MIAEQTGCFACRDTKAAIAGVLWPMWSDGDETHDWIERCDECQRYADDYAAAEALADALGIKGFNVQRIHRGLGRFQPFIERQKGV